MRKAAGPIVSLSAGDNVLHPVRPGHGGLHRGADEGRGPHRLRQRGVKRLLLRYAPVEKL